MSTHKLDTALQYVAYVRKEDLTPDALSRLLVH